MFSTKCTINQAFKKRNKEVSSVIYKIYCRHLLGTTHFNCLEPHRIGGVNG
jgi:hypothetical protein